MSDLSPYAASTRCPSCNLSVSSQDVSCPNCGHELRKSDLEVIAAQYKNQVVKRTKKRSWWISISLIFFTLFWILGLTGMSMDENTVATSSFVVATMMLVVFLALSILSFFKPITAAVIALSIYSVIAGLATIGFMTSGIQPDLVVKCILFGLLLFPLCQVIGIIVLKSGNRNNTV